VIGSFQHGNEPSDFIKYWQFLEYLKEWQLLMEDSAPWNYLFTWLMSESNQSLLKSNSMRTLVVATLLFG
jgi:hypothetical protein